MSEIKFRPTLWISFYITAIQYFSISLILIAFAIVFAPDRNTFLAAAMLIVMPIMAISIVTYENHKAGITTFTPTGLASFSFGQLLRSNYSLSWDEIYQVEPYRYFGLRFLLVRFHGADIPLWLPLFLINQTKLSLAILEHTAEDNPLHIALLQETNFSQVPWHSRIKKHKSDRYILESASAYTDRIYFSFRKYCLFSLYLTAICCTPFLLFLLLDWITIDKYFWIELGIVALFLIPAWAVYWYLAKQNYIAVRESGIELGIVSNKFHIPWSEISRVKHLNWIVIEDLCVYSPMSLYGMPYTPIRLSFIDKKRFKAAVMAYAHPENLLYEAVVKYL